jgi:PKD repeat protein
VLQVNPLLGTGTNVTMDTPVSFDASQSLPADGTDLTSWSIDYGDGTPVDSFTGPFGPADVLNTTHTFANAGISTVTLSITDSAGGTDAVTADVHVFAAPKVTLTTVGSPQAGSPLTFQVHPDTPPGTAITSYQVVVTGDDSFFVDGQGAPPAGLDLTFASGSYTVVLTVSNDAAGTAASDPVTVVVP